MDDCVPACPTAKISSALYGYKGALTPLRDQEGPSHMKMAVRFVGKGIPPTRDYFGLVSIFISPLMIPLPK